MLPAAGIGEKIMWGLEILLVIGYLAGTWLNRRRSKALGQWLQEGLKALGGTLTWKWVGTMSSGGQATVSDAGKPFRQAEITYLLLTRELLPLWGIELLRGKRDTLVMRADLRGTPVREIEVVPLHGALRRTLDRHAGDQPWEWREESAGLGLATRGSGHEGIIAAARAFLNRYGQHVQRLSLRQRRPHLILFARLTGLEQAPAADFLRAVCDVAATGQPQN
jgi:hypothetical protein